MRKTFHLPGSVTAQHTIASCRKKALAVGISHWANSNFDRARKIQKYFFQIFFYFHSVFVMKKNLHKTYCSWKRQKDESWKFSAWMCEFGRMNLVFIVWEIFERQPNYQTEMIKVADLMTYEEGNLTNSIGVRWLAFLPTQDRLRSRLDLQSDLSPGKLFFVLRWFFRN